MRKGKRRMKNDTITLSQFATEFTEAMFSFVVGAMGMALDPLASSKNSEAMRCTVQAQSMLAERIEEALAMCISSHASHASDTHLVGYTTATINDNARHSNTYLVGYTTATINGDTRHSELNVWQTSLAKNEKEALANFRKYHVSILSRKYIVQWVGVKLDMELEN